MSELSEAYTTFHAAIAQRQACQDALNAASLAEAAALDALKTTVRAETVAILAALEALRVATNEATEAFTLPEEATHGT